MSQEKVPVSVCIIAKNEERRLPECLQSVQWADEVVVLDDESTDKTIEIAKNYHAKVFSRKMDNEGRHRNYAYSLAKNDWALSLDADERVTPELAEEIKKMLRSTNGYSAFSIPIRTYIGKRWVLGAGYYPAPKVRLFQKDKFKYEEAGVHPRIFLEGKCGNMKSDIIHYSCRDFSDWLSKFNRETTLEAEKWVKDGRKVTFPKILRKMIDRFIKFYFLRDGWRDGFQGFIMSYFHSLYQLITYAKYWEMKKES